MMTYLQKIFYLLIPLFIYSCTNITHEMAKEPPLIPLPKNTLTAVIEDARNIDKGFGTFGDINWTNQNKIGRKLTTDYGKPISQLHPNETSLENIFDINDTEDLKEGKYLRIIINGKNIMSNESNGLNLKPISKNLTDYIVTPQKDQCFIDSIMGRFVLPRPCYWSKLESIDNIENADIFEENPESIIDGSIYSEQFTNIKFGNSLCRRAYASSYGNPGVWTNEGYRYIYPNGNSTKDWSKGTISCYSQVSCSSSEQLNAIGRGRCSIKIGPSPLLYVAHECKNEANGNIKEVCFKLYVNGTVIKQYNSSENTTYHVYLVWNDEWYTRVDKKTVKVFINGIEELQYNEPLPTMLKSTIAYLTLYNYAYAINWYGSGSDGNAYSYIDNLKIWREVVSEDPSWEYNREDALHVIYGENNNYQPNDIKVGYYYIP